MKMSGVHAQPQGPAFDIVLLLHVGCVVAGLATVVTSAATAARLRRLLRAGSSLPVAVVRYFRPGVNWAGRLLYGIPIFGFALLAMSHGAYALSDGWVASGLAVLVVVVVLAEGVLWPAERRIQASVSSGSASSSASSSDAASTSESAPEDGPEAGPDARGAPTVLRDAQLIVWSAALALVLLLVGTVLMVAQP
jgi:hypothetical protein